MNLRTKKIMAVLLAGTLGTGAIAVSAANLTRKVEIRYNNIGVQVDGQMKQPNMEPFFLGDSVYVSLRDAAQLIGSNVNWNGSSQTVEINTSTIANSELEQELASKNHQLAVANSEIKKMEEKIAKYEKQLGISDDKDKEEDKDTTTSEDLDLKGTLKVLDKYYSDKYDVEWDFRLTGDEKKLTFEMRYDSKKYGSDFKAISKTSLEKLAKDIMKEIQSECGKIKVVGKVYDTYEKETRAEFDITDKGVFSFEYLRSANFDEKELKDFAKILEDKFKDFPSLNLGGAFDGSSIHVREIKLAEDSKNLEFNIYTDYANMSIAKKAWDNMDATAKNLLKEYMEDITDIIEDEFDTDAKGYVYNESKEIIAKYDGYLKLN
nr:stalk domain-containing protein [uncultured Niameybacter sp.]